MNSAALSASIKSKRLAALGAAGVNNAAMTADCDAIAQAVIEHIQANALIPPGIAVVTAGTASAQTGAIGMIAYSSSKGAMVTMTRSMAQEFGPYGITANNIPPGSVMGTIMSEANRDKFQIPTEVLLSTIPVRRMGEPDDIANACSWLASEASSYVTGQTIGVNGGRVVT